MVRKMEWESYHQLIEKNTLANTKMKKKMATVLKSKHCHIKSNILENLRMDKNMVLESKHCKMEQYMMENGKMGKKMVREYKKYQKEEILMGFG
jgi:iron uptake system EfeUOB component EfeO/EfeM